MGWAEDGSWEQSGAAVRAHCCAVVPYCAVICLILRYVVQHCATLCLIMLYCATLQCHTTQTVFLFQVTMSLPRFKSESGESRFRTFQLFSL